MTDNTSHPQSTRAAGSIDWDWFFNHVVAATPTRRMAAGVRVLDPLALPAGRSFFLPRGGERR